MYTYPTKSYRDVIRENGLEHSSKTSEETQLLILDWMMREQEKYPKGSKVAYDRSPWDNLAYTLQGNANGRVSDEITAATISFVKEAVKGLDIIFWIPFDEDIKIIEDDLRDTNAFYIKQTDAIFKSLFDQYSNDLENDVFYPKDDCPAIIKLEGKTVDDRLFYISQFIDQAGELIGEETSILDPQNVDILEQMINDQQKQKVEDVKMKTLLNQISQITL
jgi:hypothetical protein